jgi:hypothetical protein
MRQSRIDAGRQDQGVTNLVEYVIISGILMILMIVVMFTANTAFMEDPARTASHHAFVDIGNGLSTRIVDIYVIAPMNGRITTKFDIPDDVASRDYFVEAMHSGTNQDITVSRGDIKSSISLAGIGATRGVTGNTTGRGWNKITYDSGGV